MPRLPHHPCGQDHTCLSRREMLTRCAGGFGALALASLLGPSALAGEAAAGMLPSPHFRARAKRVIFLYMDGGPSQVDTFDPKPALTRYAGQNPAKVMGKLDATQFGSNGLILPSPWKFRQYGQSGLPISDLFPHVARHADKLCVLRSMTAKFPEHTSANYFLHTGSGLQGRPSMGAWASYGLGSASDNLPSFVVINGGLIPPGGVDNFGSGFLPASHQASIMRPAGAAIANVQPQERTADAQQAKLGLVAALDRAHATAIGHPGALEAAIANQETAFAMQASVPELMDFAGESKETLDLYGFEAPFPQTRIFARQCLMARRLCERGVRFIELTCPSIGGNDRWDQHGNLKRGHEDNARAVDQPIAALLTDLERTGLLDDTLVLWGGEFGRTPFAQGSDGRDHNPQGFSMWMAGGGVKGGIAYGATDAFGYRALEDPMEMHDLHATMLHLLGMDHERLTYRFGGRDMRLTDVHGRLVKDILA